MYVAEVSPPSLRGRMGTLYQLSIVIGVLMSYGINYLLRNAGASNWRWMFITGVIPSVLFFVLLLRAPETPRYLFMAGRPQEAFTILGTNLRTGDRRIRNLGNAARAVRREAALARFVAAGNSPRGGGGFLPGHPDSRLRHQHHHRLRSGHLQVGRLED